MPPSHADPTDVLDLPTAGGKVIRGSALRTSGYAVGVILGIASAALLLRHLGVVRFGQYVTVMALISLVSGLSEAGLSSIGVREYATRQEPDRVRLMRNLLGIRLSLTVIGVAVATVFAAAAGYERVMVGGTVLAGLGLLLNTAQQTVGVPLSASLRFGWVSILDLARQAASMLAIVGLVAVGAELLPFFAAPVPVGLLVLVLTISLVRRLIPLVPAFERDEWTRILRLTLAYSAASAVGTIYVHTAVITTSLVASEVETGYFGAAFRIFMILAAVPLLIVTTAFPVLARAARDDRARMTYAVQRLSEGSLIVGVWMALSTLVGASLAIELIAGPKFEPSVGVLRIQGVALVGSFLVATWGFALVSLHRHRVLLAANALGLALSVVLTVLLVPRLGAEGAAWATLVGELAIAGVYAVALFARDVRIPFSRVVPSVALAAVLAAAAALVAGLPDVLRVIAVTGVYFAVLAALGALPSEVREAFVAVRGRAVS